jgi:uncharacterized protein (TIGR02271 family)
MAQTVIGMFDNASEAQHAVQQLVSKGISRENIDISAGTSSHSSGTNSGEKESGIAHFFKSLFSDDDDSSNKYSTVAQRSGSIVTVHAQSADQAETAADVLDDAGAVDVDERAAAYGYSGQGSSAYADVNTSGESTRIPIIEESLEVGKREVSTGGTRLRSRIIERPVEESLRLREESVRVERTPVDRVATSEDLRNFTDKEIELTETAEVPVVSKEARVVEEVSLGKEVNERTETISDTVRKTEVDVEELGTERDYRQKSGL